VSGPSAQIKTTGAHIAQVRSNHQRVRQDCLLEMRASTYEAGISKCAALTRASHKWGQGGTDEAA
jgi:hypothetical protein